MKLCRRLKSTSRNNKRDLRGILWILPSFAGVLVFYLLPYADVVRRSFLGAVDNQFKGIDNYRLVLDNMAFQLAVKNTVRFTFICIPALILIALVCAVVLQKSRYGGVIKSAFLMPMALPAVSVALMWRLLFHSQGILNDWLSALDINGKDWMNNSSAGFWWELISGKILDMILFCGWRDFQGFQKIYMRRHGWTALPNGSVF